MKIIGALLRVITFGLYPGERVVVFSPALKPSSDVEKAADEMQAASEKLERAAAEAPDVPKPATNGASNGDE